MKSFLIKVFLFLLFFFPVKTAIAGNLTNVKDTITTSRPSAASPVSADAAAGLGAVSVYDNKSIYLASDSAQLVKTATNAFVQTGINVASQSAARTTVYFTTPLGASGAMAGADVLIVPITAKHTIVFKTETYISATGDLEIILSPGNSTNQASPSATGFSFNNLQTTDIAISGPTCSAWTVTASTGIIKCTSLSAVAANTTVTVTIGSTLPVLINPTKTATIGTADTWAVSLVTYDATGIELDRTKVKIGTIESVMVRATVEPTLTFTIAGIADLTQISTNNVGCTNPSPTQSTNTGITSTATVVDMGILSNGAISYAAQDLTISTNMSGGYVLTATSSGQLKNPATGYKIANAQGAVVGNDNPVPVAITSGAEAFGIHVCGYDVASATWGIRTTTANTKYALPSAAYYYTLASETTAVTSSKTTVVYGGTVSATTPPGLYTTVLTYVATPIF